MPPTWGYGKQGNAQAGIKGTDTLVFVVDIENTFNAKSSAKGKDVAQNDAALPEGRHQHRRQGPLHRGAEGRRADEAGVELRHRGRRRRGQGGPTAVLVQYKGVLWDTGKEFDSTYSSGALASFSLQQVVKGWAQGLTGKKVGSRVAHRHSAGAGLRRQPAEWQRHREGLHAGVLGGHPRQDVTQPSRDVRLSVLLPLP